MAHFKRKKPRTKDRGVSDYNHMLRRRREKGGDVDRLYSSCPSGWNTYFHIRPNRRKTRHNLQMLIKGADPDAMVWPVARKPHIYFW